MGRFLIVLLIIGVISAVVYALYQLQQRIAWRRQQHKLVQLVPEILRGDPLVEIATNQGRRIEEAAEIFRQLGSDVLNVHIPEPHATTIRNWMSEYMKGRTLS